MGTQQLGGKGRLSPLEARRNTKRAKRIDA